MLIVHGNHVQVRWVIAIVLTVFALLGCSDSDDPPIYCLDSIDSSDRAEWITEQIIYSIYYEIRDLPSGTYVDKVVLGARGKMTINGYICIYCGLPSVTIDVNVKMENYSRLPQIRNDTNGEVNYVEEDGIITITDNGSPITFTLDDPYVHPSEGFNYCPHSFEDISDTITAFSASASSENLWYICSYCSREVRPYGYVITDNGQFDF